MSIAAIVTYTFELDRTCFLDCSDLYIRAFLGNCSVKARIGSAMALKLPLPIADADTKPFCKPMTIVVPVFWTADIQPSGT